MRVEVELRAGSAVLGSLTAIWEDGRAEIDRDEERALEALAGSLTRTTRRLLSPRAPAPVELVADGSGRQPL